MFVKPLSKPLRELKAISKDKIRPAIQRFSYIYLAITMLFALAGYAFLLLFPALVLFGIGYLYEAFANGQIIAWNELLTINSLILFSCLVSIRIFKTRIAPPKGPTLKEDKAPALFDLIRELQKQYRGTSIARVIISGEFELDIVKNPKWCLPFWSVNTLVIGLPLLKLFSPNLFQCALAGKVGQFSKRTNIVTNWLVQMRGIWWQYHRTYAEESGIDRLPLLLFFKIYAPVYRYISAYAAHLDILAADRYILEKNGDVEALKTLCTLAVAGNYLKYRYWPIINKMPLREGAMSVVYTRMSQLWQKWLASGQAKNWMQAMSTQTAKWNDPAPSLGERIENIGHLEGRLPSSESTSAAAFYLGVADKSVSKIIALQWLAANKSTRAAQRNAAKAGWLHST